MPELTEPLLYALVVLAMATAFRRGSLFDLTTENVQVDKGIIYLEKTKNRSRLALPLVLRFRNSAMVFGLDGLLK
jgi:integrase